VGEKEYFCERRVDTEFKDLIIVPILLLVLFVHWFRVGKYKKTHTAIDLGALCNVIGVNEAKTSVSVEPLVTIGFVQKQKKRKILSLSSLLSSFFFLMFVFSQLSKYLDERGLTLPMVPELDDLTIGGMMAGYIFF